MQFVQPAILSKALRRVILTLAIVTQKACALGKTGIRRRNHSAITVSPEIFCRIETESRGLAEGTAASPLRIAAVRLRGIFDDGNPDLRNFLQTRRHAVKVHRHHGSATLRASTVCARRRVPQSQEP